MSTASGQTLARVRPLPGRGLPPAVQRGDGELAGVVVASLTVLLLRSTMINQRHVSGGAQVLGTLLRRHRGGRIALQSKGEHAGKLFGSCV